MNRNTVKKRKYQLEFTLASCKLNEAACEKMIETVNRKFGTAFEFGAASKLEESRPEKEKCVYVLTVVCDSCRTQGINKILKRTVQDINGVEVRNRRLANLKR